MLSTGIISKALVILLATVAGIVVGTSVRFLPINTNKLCIMIPADGNDWVNIDYVLLQANAPSTADARQGILQKASEYARSGPWSQHIFSLLSPS